MNNSSSGGEKQGMPFVSPDSRENALKPEYDVRRIRSPWPYIISVAVLLLYILIFHIVVWWQGIIAFAAMAAAFVISSRFFPPREVKIPRRKELKASGDGTADKIIREAKYHLLNSEKSLVYINRYNRAFEEKAATLISYGYKILGYVTENPKQVSLLRRFFNYYVPTLDKLLKTYITLSEHGADGKNAAGTKSEIEEAVGAMETVFAGQLDKLFFDTALDISTDIDVLEGMLSGDGLVKSTVEEEHVPDASPKAKTNSENETAGSTGGDNINGGNINE